MRVPRLLEVKARGGVLNKRPVDVVVPTFSFAEKHQHCAELIMKPFLD